MQRAVSNTPQEHLIVKAEARKSFAFGVWLQDGNEKPLDSSGAALTLVIGKVDRYGVATTKLTKSAVTVGGPGTGFWRFPVQASELNFKPDTYQYSITYQVLGYSVVVAKGDFVLEQNTEYGSIGSSYSSGSTEESLIVRISNAADIRVTIGNVYPPDLLRTPLNGLPYQQLAIAADGSFVWATASGSSDSAVASYVASAVSLTRAALDTRYATISYTDMKAAAAIVSAGSYTDTKAAAAVATAATDATTKANAAQAAAATDATTKANAAQSAAASDATSKAGTAQTNAQSYAAGLNTAMDTRVTEREGMNQLALLDPAYRGPGPAKVAFFTSGTTLGALSSTAYEWLDQGAFKRHGNRVVEMQRIGNVWFILSHSGRLGFGGKQAVSLNATYCDTYNRINGSDTWSEPRVIKTHTGIVALGGMIGFRFSGAASGTTVAYLPAGYRPDKDILFITNNNGARMLLVKANGDIQLYGTGWVTSIGAWFSLDGIMFPAAGIASWTDISSFSNSWTYNSSWDTQYGRPRYWKDPYEIVWFQGMVYNGTTAADNTPMFTLPAGYRINKESHIISGGAGGGSDGFSYVGPKTTGTVDYKTGSMGNGYVALGRVTLITTAAMSGLIWDSPGFVNGWSNNNATSYTSVQSTLRPDGIAMAQGLALANASGAGTDIASSAPWGTPEKQCLMPAVQNAAFGRLDINGYGDTGDKRGRFNAAVATNSNWFSLDGHKWIAD